MENTALMRITSFGRRTIKSVVKPGTIWAIGPDNNFSFCFFFHLHLLFMHWSKPKVNERPDLEANQAV
jgi:hypothetical protein